MERQPVKISFNKEWVKSVSKDEFVQLVKDVYPDNDPEAEWAKVGSKEEPKPATKVKEPESKLNKL